MLPARREFLGAIYSFGALLSFTMAHAAVVRLRDQAPDFARVPRAHAGNLGGSAASTVPLFAVVGGTFNGDRLRVIVALNIEVAAAGFGWLVIGT